MTDKIGQGCMLKFLNIYGSLNVGCRKNCAYTLQNKNNQLNIYFPSVISHIVLGGSLVY